MSNYTQEIKGLSLLYYMMKRFNMTYADAIDEMENPGPDVNRAMEAIEDHLEDFNKACLETLKDITKGKE